jgi:hypothetical protein
MLYNIFRDNSKLEIINEEKTGGRATIVKSVEDEDDGADGNSSSRFSGGTMSGTLG